MKVGTKVGSDGQQPLGAYEDQHTPDMVWPHNCPDAKMLYGVPLDEDKKKGVQPGEPIAPPPPPFVCPTPGLPAA